jgi:hypothetical protein
VREVGGGERKGRERGREGRGDKADGDCYDGSGIEDGSIPGREGASARGPFGGAVMGRR